MARHPYMNRGNYEWVPDYYASTTEDNFVGVMRSYDAAVIDYGRPRNALPAERGGYAAGTEIYGRALRNAMGGVLIADGDIISPEDASGNGLDIPFLSMLMRETSTTLDSLPTPDDDEGIGFSSFEVWADENPYYIFTVDDIASTNGRIASITIEYALLTSSEWEQAALANSLAGTTPVSIVALFDENDVGSWYDLARPTGEEGGQWGPVSDQIATGPAVTEAASLLGEAVKAVHIPPYTYDATGKISIDELNVTHSGAYSNPANPNAQQWDVAEKRIASIKLTGRYFTNPDFYPRLRAIMVMPNDRGGSSRLMQDGQQAHWNCVISGVRVYDAVQQNAVPEHIEADSNGNDISVPSQFPCELFGYAWRISHAVQMSKYTSAIQPSVGTTLSDTPGNARRRGTFRFKLYHPDRPGLGVAHSVRFYYGLVVLPIPGTSPMAASFSLMGQLASMSADMDLLMVQYIGPLPGKQSLTFIPGNRQNSENDLGRVAYGGEFAYARQTMALKCFGLNSGGDSPPTKSQNGSDDWRMLGGSDLPSGENNGLFPLWYDEAENAGPDTWYSFVALDAVGVEGFNANVPASYSGGVTPAVRGTPMTNKLGVGSFGMSPTLSTGFAGAEKVSVHCKPKCISSSSTIDVNAFCSDINMDSHLATFVSDGANIGNNVDIFSGDWRIRFAADLDNGDLDNVQVFYRFAFVDAELDEDELNGSRLWSHNDQVIEFHFRPTSGEGGLLMATGTPSAQSLISTPPLVAEELAYDLTWFCPNAAMGDSYLSPSTDTNLLERVFDATDLPWSSTKVVIQAWAVAYSRPGVPVRNPESEKTYPVVKFSWAGDTDAAFQTMITETRSGAILAQQDPVVDQYQTEQKKIITVQDQGVNPDAQSSIGPFRDKGLFNANVTLNTDQFTIGSDNSDLSELGLLTDEGANGLTISGVLPKGNYDPLDEAAQIADTLVELDSGSDAIIGGTTIPPQTIEIHGNMEANNSTFDSKVIISLYLVDTDVDVAYLLGSSNSIYNISEDNDPADTSTIDLFGSRIEIGQSISVPGLRSRLMLRFRVWAYDNGNADREMAEVDIPEFDAGYRSLDFIDLELRCETGIELISNEAYLLGSNNWYQNLPVSSGRTFGSTDYYFVADESSTQSVIMPPSTMSNYGYWYLHGWLFSPFWYLDMPDGSVFEIQDRAGLTMGNPTTGSNIGSTERAHRALRVRTAIDTLPSLGVSADRGGRSFGSRGYLAIPRSEDSSEELGGDSIGIVSIQDHRFMSDLVEHVVRAGEQVIVGKNPLVVAMDPDNEWMKHLKMFYGFAHPEMRLLFYEDSEFDAESHQSSITMLANYDGTCSNWQNPYGEPDSGGDSQIVVTNDMKMLGAAVDPWTFTLYLVGYRASDPTSPQDGGMIVMRVLQPFMVFSTVSAATGPLHFVDGAITEDAYNTSSVTQPFLPEDLASDGTSRANALGPNGNTMPASESFPDVFVDGTGMVYVFYALMSDPEIDGPGKTTGTKGKVFCRRSTNGGYHFEAPFAIADLGYSVASRYPDIRGDADDESFDVKHIVSLYSDLYNMYLLFFWAGGKIFMRSMQHPAILANRASSTDTPRYTGQNQLLMVAGSTDFVDGKMATGLDRWLKMQWDGAVEATASNAGEYGTYGDEWDTYTTGLNKRNNYGTKNDGGGNAPYINIARYNNDPDVPPQRIGVYMAGSTNDAEIILTFLDEQFRPMHKRIRFSGQYPHITPALHLETQEI